MALTSSESKYGIGREQTPGTYVEPGNGMLETKGGLPLEELAAPMLGDDIRIHPKQVSLPFDCEYSRINAGKAPAVPQVEHNLVVPFFGLLLCSFTPVSEAADLATIVPGTSGHVCAEYGTLNNSNFSFTFRWEHGGTGSVNEAVGGCICDNLQLTFPADGGPVRMSWSARGMVSSEAMAAATAATYGYHSATAVFDLLASDFRYFFGTESSPTEFYPDGDVVITFTPQLQFQNRCQGRPHMVTCNKYMGTVEFTFPWDTDPGDINELYDGLGTRKSFAVTNAYDSAWNDAPDAAGEMLIHCGVELNPTLPSREGEGIIGERATFDMTGKVAQSDNDDKPYYAKIYDGTTYDDFA